MVAVDGTIVSWSPEAERLFKTPGWDAVGRPCHEVVAGTFTNGAAACVVGCPVRRKARLGVAPPSYDLQVGNRLLRVHHVALWDPAGYIAGVLHVVDPDVRVPLRTRRSPA